MKSPRSTAYFTLIYSGVRAINQTSNHVQQFHPPGSWNDRVCTLGDVTDSVWMRIRFQADLSSIHALPNLLSSCSLP